MVAELLSHAAGTALGAKVLDSAGDRVLYCLDAGRV
jgi:hypothetical protein